MKNSPYFPLSYSNTFLLFLVLSINTLQATTRNVPGTYATIQAALNAATTGDIILVQPGTYVEQLVWPNVNHLILRSNGNASNTIIDAANAGRACYLYQTSANKNACIEGFTFQNGTIGGSSAYGAGIYSRGYDLLLSDVIIQDNIATGSSRAYGGGLYVYNNSSLVLNNASFLRNQVNTPGSWAYGGGLYTHTGSNVNMTNVLFDGNLATSPSRTYGAAIYGAAITGTWNSITLQNNECQQASWAGAAIYLSDNSTITINDASINNNHSEGVDWGYGGGLRITESNVTIDGISASCNSGNAGSWAYSANIYTDGASGSLVELNMTNALICDNPLGGNNTWSYGGAAYVRDFTNLNLVNCSFGGNTYIGSGPNTQGLAIFSGATSNTITAVNSIFYNPTGSGPELGGPNFNITFSDIRGSFAGTGNVNIDPLWVGAGDYHFSGSSPISIINGGSNVSAPTADIDNTTRPAGGTTAMGAYEEGAFTPETACDWRPVVATVLSTHPTLLPLNNLTFEAKVQGKSVRTQWQTLTEVQSDYFEIQRSLDGIQFETIGKVNAEGNSAVPLNYDFVDHQPYLGISYYRLKLVDLNTLFSYSDLTSILIETNDETELYPTLWTNNLQTIHLSANATDQITVQLISTLGQELIPATHYTINANNVHSFLLPITTLANGHYFLKISGKQLNVIRKVTIRK